MDRRRFLALVAKSLPLAGIPFLAPSLLASGSSTYTVLPGDTLSGIAKKFGTSVASIRQANGIQGDLIRAGEVLQIPGDDYLHEVRRVCEPMRGGLRTWRYVVGHHSGIDRGNAKSYGEYHLRRGMQNGLAYHFVIGNGIDSGDGEIEIGPRWYRQLQGGHVRSHEVNMQGIGICVVGNFEKRHPSARQLAAFTSLVAYLRDLVPNRTKFAVHREIDGRNHTVCPGRNFPIASLHRRFPDEW